MRIASSMYLLFNYDTLHKYSHRFIKCVAIHIVEHYFQWSLWCASYAITLCVIAKAELLIDAAEGYRPKVFLLF